MEGYIKALRYPICLFAAFLTILSFHLVTGKTNNAALPAFSVLIIACSTMVWNDFRDRKHDLGKGKDFAYKHEKTFLIYAITFWLISVTLAVLLGIVYNFRFSCLAFLMICSGLIYSETRRIAFVPNTLVALTSASATLFPAFIGFHKSLNLWILFVATFLVIYSREIAKDFDDIAIDRTYKWTLLQLIGREASLRAMVFLLGIGSAITVLLGSTALASLVTMYVVFLIMSEDTLELTTYAKAAKWTLDAGMFFLISSLFVCPIP